MVLYMQSTHSAIYLEMQIIKPSIDQETQIPSERSMNKKKLKVGHGDIFGGNDLILCDILSRLPVKTLMRFKLVCTHWRFLIKENKYLIDLHLLRSKTRREGIKLLISSVLGRKTALFFCDLFQGGTATPLLGRKTTDDNIFDDAIMLNPVNGLICFVKPFEGCVLIYNPSTGDKTSWLETRTRKLPRDLDGQAVDTSRMRWGFGFGFGFDPATKQHKVVSVFETINTEEKISNENPYGLDTQQCEVLTIGGVRNEWREIDKKFTPGKIVGASVYVNGVIYWLDEHQKVHEVVMAFDVTSEKFNQVTVIPTFINNRWRDFPVNGGMQTIWIYVDLLEVDGHIALWERVDGCSINLWTYDDVNTNGIIHGNRSEEKIKLPFNLWD
ncbi:putative F-box protein At1g32420 [Papaver somniferum]|uniref:putative F-box protein At1g32420 n=1 Tax=Papaver somniferum TaxID=3469 RepID=UPI000E6F4671|nr:putative F-box protein At1g32420 [Papaver somniferum]